jgi:zinc D-Ala-D-Ala dipeptidase
MNCARTSASRIAWIVLTFTSGVAAAEPAPQTLPAKIPEEAGMVDIRALVTDFDVNMRYAGPANFVGTPIEGYEAPRCYLLRPVARALQRVELRLRRQQMRLKVFDCYRPVRAVKHFVRWAGDLQDQRTKALYYPHLDKSVLLGDYIAPMSGHSRGATVDLTLMRCPDGGACEPLDMGTEFDFFDELAHTDAPDLTPEQRDNRLLLRSAMEREGFQNYALEWWHYTLEPEPAPYNAYDFPVR